MEYWLQVRKDLGFEPIVAGMIEGDYPVFAERYLYRSPEKTVSGLRGVGLVTQLGGSRVQEGERGQLRADSLPTRSILVPANCPTHWNYSGTVDFANFYFPEHLDGIQESLRELVEARGEPMVFGDTLVGATALQLVSELNKGASADKAFMALLVEVMLKQTYRALTTPDTGAINPRHIHFSRLQAVLGFIHEHLAEKLSIDLLAAEAQVSQTHFRRLFLDAMGVPPHRYILALRLERARNLLSMTTMPIARIALSCGFSDQSHLTASFRSSHVVTPAEFRARIGRSASPRQGI
jgi:AraC family transcriptional regulator